MTDHYETLGVSRDASQEDIKKAYRKRAREAHPDRGGSAEDMTNINVAFECLSNPQRRIRYDASGNDDKRSDDEKVRNAVQQLMAHCVDKDINISGALALVTQNLTQAQQQLAATENRLRALRNRVGTVGRKSKKGENVFEKELMKKIFTLENVVKNLHEDARLLGLVRKEVRDYVDMVKIHHDPSGLSWPVKVTGF